MRKMETALGELAPPTLDGPADAEVTLVGWGSTKGVIMEAIRKLAEEGISANQLHVKYLVPFHTNEISEILRKCKRTICIEANYTGQFARHLRAETGITIDDHIRKYDGEPFEPHHIVEEVKAILAGTVRSTDVTQDEAREMAYHYIRTRLSETLRPGAISLTSREGIDEQLWSVEVVTRDAADKSGELLIGIESGSSYSWRAAELKQGASG